MICCCAQGSNPDRRDFRLSNVSLPATVLFNVELQAEKFDSCLFAGGKREIQYRERGAVEYACKSI